MSQTAITPSAKEQHREEIQKKVNTHTLVKRDGTLVPFRTRRIIEAIEGAFRDVKELPHPTALSQEIENYIADTTYDVLEEILRRSENHEPLTVEGIQDIVEMKLMERDHLDVAKGYIIYRDQHKSLRDDSPQNIKVKREDDTHARLNPMKIAASIESAFKRAYKIKQTPPNIVEAINILTEKIVEQLISLNKNSIEITTTDIEDEIEKQLMQEGYFPVAKTYILYRAGVDQQQSAENEAPSKSRRKFTVTTKDQGTKTLTESDLRNRLKFACRQLDKLVSIDDLLESVIMNFYEGIKEEEVDTACIMAARTKIEIEPAYSQVASRLLLDIIYRETMQIPANDAHLEKKHRGYFKSYIKKGIEVDRLSEDLLSFDLDALSKALILKRDDKFSYLGLQTLYDRYFIHENLVRLETPQIFWMRVAMGLSLNEGEQKNQRAIEFYNILSEFTFVSSTPTLFNSGTQRPQLSSCFLLTIKDDLEHIFKTVSDDAQLSKWSGGLGNDWTSVRATGSLIKGTNGKSQGVIPFLKVANDTAVAVNQGGKRKGAMCAYLETWHLDIEDFLELRKNTGDERRRTHDMNTANWIPDLFMKRVTENQHWTLFSPSDAPDLHDLYGKAFEERYAEYERMTETGEIKLFKKVEATQLWRKMLSMLFETGHPWITFKDPSNIRSAQDHVGVVHSSNLCTEILLNTSRDEVAVCNLGSVNLVEHMGENGLEKEKLAHTIRSAIRMLDNVIDINYYPIPEAKNANQLHRPIGMGLMGFQDALYLKNLSYASHEAVKFADETMEFISYHATLSSSLLAKERGTYSSYKGSKWDRGLLPIDTLELLEQERGLPLEVDRSMSMDWSVIRESIKEHGMRNSHTMAIAPTATLSNITGVTQSIEPSYKNLFVKSNLSGEFTVPNLHLVQKLKDLKLWDDEMLDDLKYFDGSIQEIERIPDAIKQMFLSAFEIDPEWLIECASRRQKWIDMGQSFNTYLAEPSGKKLHQMYMLSWSKGLKTNYYLRTLGATQIEKSTTDINKRGLQPRWMKNKSASSDIALNRETKNQPEPDLTKLERPMSCNLEEGCESCQ